MFDCDFFINNNLELHIQYPSGIIPPIIVLLRVAVGLYNERKANEIRWRYCIRMVSTKWLQRSLKTYEFKIKIRKISLHSPLMVWELYIDQMFWPIFSKFRNFTIIQYPYFKTSSANTRRQTIYTVSLWVVVPGSCPF